MTNEHHHGYRDAEIKPYCSICSKVADKTCLCCKAPVCLEHVHRCECGKEAAGACLRCEKPLCEEHVHAKDKRCERCEELYTERGLRLGVANLFLILVPFLWSVSFLASGIKALPHDPSTMDYGVFVLECLATIGGLILLYRLLAWLQGRNRFLRERIKR